MYKITTMQYIILMYFFKPFYFIHLQLYDAKEKQRLHFNLK